MAKHLSVKTSQLPGQKYGQLLAVAIFSLLAAGCNPFSQTLPGGIAKSVNGGVDWQFANAIKNASNGASMASLNISRLAFDPNNRQVVYAGSYTDGLYKSEDAAATWTNILSRIAVYDLATDPNNSKILYAAGFYAGHGRVLKTTDGGASWNQIYNEASANNAVRSVAVDPDNSNYLAIGTSLGSVIKSADGGQTWQLAKNFNDKVNRILWRNGNLYVLLKGQGLFLSADLANNFTEITASLKKTYNVVGLSYTSTAINSFNQVYVDSDSANLIYLATDRGLYKTLDGGTTWNLLNLPVQPNQSNTQTAALARSSSNIVYTSVGATVYKSLDGGQSWQTQGINTAGYINFLLVDPQLPQIVYGGIYVPSQ